MSKESKKQKEAAEQAAKDAAAKADFDRAMADQKGFYDDGHAERQTAGPRPARSEPTDGGDERARECVEEERRLPDAGRGRPRQQRHRWTRRIY